MKTSKARRNELHLKESVEMVPSDTAHEHLQRVEEWTINSTTAPPSNRKRSAKEQENNDHEAKSQLIAEAVELLDSRDKQTRSRTPTGGANDTQHYDNDSDQAEDESQFYSIGNHFRNSKLSARNYVKHFENKVRRKKAREEAISSTYPPVRSRKDLMIGLSAFNGNSSSPVVEPDSWRFKASRSVKFAVKSGSQQEVIHPLSEEASEDGEKWGIKQENDRDWWRWKLKQRFLQNDELLHKLATQRQKLESSLVPGGNHRINRNLIFNNKKGQLPPSKQEQPIQTAFPTARNSSWHVSVEIPSHMTPAINSSTKRINNSIIKSSQQLTRDPIPNFYTPSKQFVTAMTNPPTVDDFSIDPDVYAKQKLKVLKKDPYLSKLLAGNEMFRPEMMLDDNQQNRKNQSSQEYKSPSGNNPRRKLSLESLTDTEDELSASKFFNPDVKVLYERLSEMEMLNSKNLAEKSRIIGVHSREPSDGFLNLPILLETGRFSRYNKLPSMKLISTNKDVTSKHQAKKSEKSYKRLQSALNKMKKSTNLTNINLLSSPIVGAGGTTITTEANLTSFSNQHGKIEDLPTNEWAKKIMSKVKKQDNSTKTDDDGNLMEDAHKNDEFNEILNVPLRKYKVPIDQETNLLYHEILMSKWKKDKHNKEKDNDVIGKNKHLNLNSVKWKRGELVHDKKKFGEDMSRPRGLDIWLENIREKAKRDRVISPLPNNADVLKRVSSLVS